MPLPFDNGAPSAERLIAYTDGGARGNPGPAGFGVRIEHEDGSLVTEFGEAIGTATNNVAEYRGLLAALEWAVREKRRRLHVRSDSQLLVQQMLGRYKVKHPGLQPLYERAKALAKQIGVVTFEYVARAQNAHADRLANEAMDAIAVPARPPAAASEREVFTRIERAVRAFVYQHFVNTARAPDTAAIARHTTADRAVVTAALRTLADARALVLAPATVNIWMAHPFSAVPTAYPVNAKGLTYYANCAWDALGVLSIVGDGESRTRCDDCGEELSLAVEAGRIVGDAVVHYAVPPRRFWENVAFT